MENEEKKSDEEWIESLDYSINMNVLDLRDPEVEKAFLEALKKYGIPIT